MTQYRLEPKERKALILTAAVTVARTKGFQHMTREAIAAMAGITPALVTHHYTTMTQMRRAVMRAAVQREVLSVIAYGLVTGDRYARKASPELRQKAMDSVDGGGR